MKAFLMAAVACLWLCNCVNETFAQEENPESKTVSFADATDAPAEPATAIGGRVRVLGDREARKLGLNVFSVNRARKAWMASDDYDPNASAQERGYAVAAILAQEKQTKAALGEMMKGKSADAAALDWEAFIAAVMRIMEFIMKFFAN